MMDGIYTVKLYRTEGEALVIADGEKYRITIADLNVSGVEDGAVIDTAGLLFLSEAAEKLACIKKAFVYLSYHGLSERRLRSKLKTAGFGEGAIDRCIELLVKKGYIDDLALCRETAEALRRSKLYGASRLRKELYAKGFDGDCIDAVLEDGEWDGDDVSAITELLEKKFPHLTPDDRDGRAKAVAYLYRMGYKYDDINNAVSALGRD